MPDTEVKKCEHQVYFWNDSLGYYECWHCGAISYATGEWRDGIK